MKNFSSVRPRSQYTIALVKTATLGFCSRDYSATAAMQGGYGSLGGQGVAPSQYGSSAGVGAPQPQFIGQHAMATPHNMQQAPQMFMSHQQDPMQTPHPGMQAPIQ